MIIKQYEILQGKNDRPKLYPYKHIDAKCFERGNSIDAQMWFLAYYMKLMRYDAEHLFALAKDDDHRILGVYLISIGDTKETDCNNRNLSLFLLLSGASQFILAHNHPNHCLEPSENDILFNLSMVALGNQIGIELQGNYVITKDGYHNIQTGETNYFDIYDYDALIDEEEE